MWFDPYAMKTFTDEYLDALNAVVCDKVNSGYSPSQADIGDMLDAIKHLRAELRACDKEAGHGVSFLTDAQFAARLSVHPKTPWMWARTNPSFPQPVKLSNRCTRWRVSDIEAWEKNLS